MIAPVVDVSWVTARRHGIVLVDARSYLDGRSGREAYERGHIPGAVHVALEELAAPPSPAAGRHPLPAPADFAAVMARVGIGDGATVVAYDDDGGAIAARLVWMLRVLGEDAALLDGGIAAWPGELEPGVAERAVAAFTARAWPADRLASIEDAADPANVVIAARQGERFRGEVEPIDPRAGHIPGARSLPCRESVAADGRLLDVAALRERLAAVGVDGDAPVVSYCGSGVTACHNLLVLEHAGLGAGRLFPGSFSQWSNDAARPVATGSA